MPRYSLVPRLFPVEEMWLGARLAKVYQPALRRDTISDLRAWYSLSCGTYNSCDFVCLPGNHQRLYVSSKAIDTTKHRTEPEVMCGHVTIINSCHNHLSTTSAITCKRLAEVPQNQRLGTEMGHSHNVQENWGRFGLLLNPKRMGKRGGGMRDCKNLSTCYS